MAFHLAEMATSNFLNLFGSKQVDFFLILHLKLLKKFKIAKILLKIHFIPTVVALTQWSKQAAILLNATALILLVKVDFGKKPCG